MTVQSETVSRTKVEMFGHNAQGHIQRNPDTAYQPKAATGPGHIVFNELKMHSSVFKVF